MAKKYFTGPDGKRYELTPMEEAFLFHMRHNAKTPEERKRINIWLARKTRDEDYIADQIRHIRTIH